MLSLYLKATHIIFVMSWFAGLVYLVRLFIYHREAQHKEESERKILSAQFEVMERRLFKFICEPSLVFTLVTGIWLMIEMKYYTQTWMHLKLGFVVLLLIYHGYCGHLAKQMRKGNFKLNSKGLRILNEISTVIIIAIVFTVVLKGIEPFAWAWGIAGFLLVALLIVGITRLVKAVKKVN